MERKAAPRDAVEYCPMVAFVSPGDSLFPLGDSRPVYERLVAPHKRMIDDVLLHRGRTSPPNHCGRTSVVWGRTQSSSGMYVPEPHRPATDNQPWVTGVAREPQSLVIQTLVTRSRLATPARVAGYCPSSCLRRCMAT